MVSLLLGLETGRQLFFLDLHLLIGVLSCLSSLNASFIILGIPTLSLLLLGLFVVIINDLVLISGVIRILSVFVGLVKSRIPCVTFQLFNCFFYLDLRRFIVVLE